MDSKIYVLSVQLEWNDKRSNKDEECPFDSRDTYVLGVMQDADLARRWVHETNEVDGVPVHASVFCACDETAADFQERSWYKDAGKDAQAPAFSAMLFVQEGTFTTTIEQLSEEATSSVGHFKEYCRDRSRLWDAVIEE